MPESPSYQDLQNLISDVVNRLGVPEQRRWMATPDVEAVDLLANALRVTLLALSASIGECRLASPYSPLHPVIDAEGTFRWCCNHDPEHCRPLNV